MLTASASGRTTRTTSGSVDVGTIPPGVCQRVSISVANRLQESEKSQQHPIETETTERSSTLRKRRCSRCE